MKFKGAAWAEGARSNAPTDLCPGCGRIGPEVVFDFRKFGQHRLVACVNCTMLYVDNEPATPLVIFPHA